MAYVAPNWKNGQAPALDAAALQAISDAIVANQTKNTQQDSSISSLQTAVNGKSRVATGSYIGTGTYGASNPNSITFPFTPKLVWLYRKSVTNRTGTSPIVPGNTNNLTRTDTVVDFSKLPSNYSVGYGPYFPGYIQSSTSDNYDSSAYARKSGYSMYWYNTRNSTFQCNETETIFHWVAFG